MFSYSICKDADNDEYLKACEKLETALPVQKVEVLVDVDGSVYATYSYQGKKIEICDDYYVGAVYCDSEIDLSEIFGKEL